MPDKKVNIPYILWRMGHNIEWTLQLIEHYGTDSPNMKEAKESLQEAKIEIDIEARRPRDGS
jgi:hypothetical protein